MTTHSWAYQPGPPVYRTAWPTLLGDTPRIIDHVRGTTRVSWKRTLRVRQYLQYLFVQQRCAILYR